MVRGLGSAPISYAKAIPAIAETVLQALPEDDDHRRTDSLFGDNQNLIGYVLEHIGWDDNEAASRRSLTYDAVERIRRLLSPAIDRVLADDVLTGIGTNMKDADSSAYVRPAVARMPEGAAALLNDALDAHSEPTTDPVYLRRARMAVPPAQSCLAGPGPWRRVAERSRGSACGRFVARTGGATSLLLRVECMTTS